MGCSPRSGLLLALLQPLPAQQGVPLLPDQSGLVLRHAMQAQLLQPGEAGQQRDELLDGGGVPRAALVCMQGSSTE